jgi:serine/threonine protein kinase
MSVGLRRLRNLSDFGRAQSAPALKELVPEKKEIRLVNKQYAVQFELGRGGEGVCYLAHDTKNDKAVALKKRHCNTAACVNEALNEATMLARVCGTLSPLFPRFYECFMMTISEEACQMFELYMSMEYIVGGELFRVLRNSEKKNTLPIERWCRELVRAIELLHALGYVHRDIKPENLLVRNDNTYTLVLCDFGSCALIDGPRAPNAGSLFYMPPENVDLNYNALVSPSRSIDWWAAGVVMLQIASRCYLFPDGCICPGAEAKRRFLGNNASLLDSISWDTFVTTRYVNALPPPFATTLGSLISSLLRLDPRHRLMNNRPLSATFVESDSSSSNRLHSNSGSPTRPPYRRMSSLNGSDYSA